MGSTQDTTFNYMKIKKIPTKKGCIYLHIWKFVKETIIYVNYQYLLGLK